MSLWIGRESYGNAAKRWLARSGHYLENPSAGSFFCVAVRDAVPDLLGEPAPNGPLLGLCVVGRPVARHLPQDGSVGEITRMVLLPGLPHGLASEVLRCAARHARLDRMTALIAYHDRTRHTGCIYRKAGFTKDGGHDGRTSGWDSRGGREKSAAAQSTPKRRWRLVL